MIGTMLILRIEICSAQKKDEISNKTNIFNELGRLSLDKKIGCSK